MNTEVFDSFHFFSSIQRGGVHVFFFTRDKFSFFRLYRDGDHIQRGGVTCTCQKGVVNCQSGVVG